MCLPHKVRECVSWVSELGFWKRWGQPGGGDCSRASANWFGAWILMNAVSPLRWSETQGHGSYAPCSKGRALSEEAERWLYLWAQRVHWLLGVWGGPCRSTPDWTYSSSQRTGNRQPRAWMHFHPSPHWTWPSELLRLSLMRPSTLPPLGIVRSKREVSMILWPLGWDWSIRTKRKVFSFIAQHLSVWVCVCKWHCPGSLLGWSNCSELESPSPG